jgi:hypothetical protein
MLPGAAQLAPQVPAPGWPTAVVLVLVTSVSGLAFRSRQTSASRGQTRETRPQLYERATSYQSDWRDLTHDPLSSRCHGRAKWAVYLREGVSTARVSCHALHVSHGLWSRFGPGGARPESGGPGRRVPPREARRISG